MKYRITLQTSDGMEYPYPHLMTWQGCMNLMSLLRSSLALNLVSLGLDGEITKITIQAVD